MFTGCCSIQAAPQVPAVKTVVRRIEMLRAKRLKFEIYVVDSPKGWTTHRPVSLGIELPSLNGNQFEKRWGSPVTSL